MIEQSLAQNIEQEIDTKTFIVYGKMRNWKTLNGICMALDFYPRIYSNVNIYQNWKSIVNYIESYDQISKIRFSYTPWVLLLDEAWLNANSKDWRNSEVRGLIDVLFLIWKKNLSVIWIAQRYESIDINARVLADAIIEMRKVPKINNHPMFICVKQKQKWAKLEWIHSYNLDSISILNYYHITYNQLEESRLSKKEDLKILKWFDKLEKNIITNNI